MASECVTHKTVKTRIVFQVKALQKKSCSFFARKLTDFDDVFPPFPTQTLSLYLVGYPWQELLVFKFGIP